MTPQELLDLADSIVFDPSLKANGGVTFCNFAVQKYLCKGAGYTKLNGLLANDMIDYMILHFQEWQKLQDGLHAKERADLGDLVIAGHKYNPHGHVAIVRPLSPSVYSGHWQLDVPTLANVGEKNGIMGANDAFPVNDTPPSYFRLVADGT